MERFNRTLKNLMWKKFTEQGNYRWVNILQNLVFRYNSFHRSILMKPVEVNEWNKSKVLNNLNKTLNKRFSSKIKKTKFKFF